MELFKRILIFTILLFGLPLVAITHAFPPSAPQSGGVVSDVAYNEASWNGVTDTAGSKNAIRDKIEGLAGGHDAVTLDANADAILDLAVQVIGLDTQTANKLFAAPATGAAAVPTFRLLVADDLPDNVLDSQHYAAGSIDNEHVAAGLDAVKTANGLVTNTEFQYLASGTEDIQTALDVRCLESVFGVSIGTGLTKDGTALKTHAALQSIAGLTEVNGGLIYGTADNTYAVLAAGATTKILVGGGAAAPVWTEATGSGAPVRANNPSFTAPDIGAATATSVTNIKSSGVAGQVGVYEANSTDTFQTGWKGAASIADDMWFQFSNADPTAGQIMVFGAPSTGVSSISWVTYAAGTKEAAWTIHDSDTVTAVADGKQAFSVPATMNLMLLSDVTCSVHDLNSASGGTTTVVVRRVRGNTPQDMTSTGVTIAHDAYTASDETVDASYDDLATGDKIYVDINAVTTGAVHKGLSCTAVFSAP